MHERLTDEEADAQRLLVQSLRSLMNTERIMRPSSTRTARSRPSSARSRPAGHRPGGRDEPHRALILGAAPSSTATWGGTGWRSASSRAKHRLLLLAHVVEA